MGVSIHAPRAGRDSLLGMGRMSVRVSIHAPARGATRKTFDEAQADLFQSTRPRGARRIFAF